MPWVDLPTGQEHFRLIAEDGGWPRYQIDFETGWAEVVILEAEGHQSGREATLEDLPREAVWHLFEHPWVEGKQVRPGGVFGGEGAVSSEQGLVPEPEVPPALLEHVDQARGLGVRLGAYMVNGPPHEINPRDPDWSWVVYVRSRVEGLHRLCERERYFWENPTTSEYGDATVLQAIRVALERDGIRTLDPWNPPEPSVPETLEEDVDNAFDLGESLGTYFFVENADRMQGSWSNPLGNNWTEPEYRRAVANVALWPQALSEFERSFRDRYGPEAHSQHAVTDTIIAVIYERRLELARS